MYAQSNPRHYLRRRLAGGEGIVSLCVRLSRCHAVCGSAALVSAAKVMRCIQCSLVRLHHIPMVKTIVFANIIILCFFVPKRSLADKHETYTGMDPKLT